MQTPKKHNCESCGGKIVEYRHGLSRGMVRILEKGYKAGGYNQRLSFKVSDNQEFTYSQRCNFQKLKYWRFVEKDETDQEQAGLWRVTELGIHFLGGETAPRSIWTFRGEVTNIDTESTTAEKADPNWAMEDAASYARKARLHTDQNQQRLI